MTFPLFEGLVPRDSQPSEVVRVNREHPLGARVRAFFVAVGGTLVDVANDQVGEHAYAGGPDTEAYPYGLGIRMLAARENRIMFKGRDAYDVLGAASFFWRGRTNSLSGYQNLACNVPPGGNGGTVNPFDLMIGPSGEIIVVRANSGYSSFSSNNVMPAAAPADIGIACGASIGDTPEFWCNGVSVGVASSGGGGGGAPTAARNDVWIGRRKDNASQLDGLVELFIILDGRMTAAEYRVLREAPYSLLADRENHTWVAAAAGAVPSITAVYADSVTASSVVPRVTLDFA